MKKMKRPNWKSILKILLIAYALVSVCTTTWMIDGILSAEYEDISQHISLDEGWDVKINDTAYEGVSLDDFTFPSVNRNDSITMTTTLPAPSDPPGYALLMQTKQGAVRVFVDNAQIYEYGFDRIARHKTVGSGYLLIDLPSDYAGKTLRIDMTVGEDKAFTRFDSIAIYEWKNVYRIVLTENRIPLFVGCFLSIFGAVACCITLLAVLFSGKYVRILCVSLFSVCIGLWTLCYYNVLLCFAMPLYNISLLEYMSLYLAPIPLIIYLKEDVLALEQPVMLKIYRILLTVQTAATTVFLALHAVDLVHCAATLKYMQLLILCNLVYFFIVEFMNLRIRHNLIHRLFLIGMLLLSGCVSYDLAYYYLNRYRGVRSLPVKGISSLGLGIFIIFLLISFYVDLTQKLMQETERNSLIKRAYTDELTQIHNRRYCMEYMERIQQAEAMDYTVFCFDLNNLKITNDTYGHAKGDILIKSAAEVITETFASSGIVARMGGDEFIAIAETADTEKLTELTETFRTCIDKKNREIPDLNMSIAYGYASCTAKEYTIEKIYQTADDRMYENKLKQKQAMGINQR